MKPTNKKEYNRSILGFFAMWAITTALIVLACLQPFKTPKLENQRLRKQVENLEADSTQQYLLYSTIRGINSAMANLNQKYNIDTLKKLRSYPNVELKDTKMKKELTTLSERVANIYEANNTNVDDTRKRLEDCQRDLATRDGELRLKQAELDLCERGTSTFQPPPQSNF